MPLFRQSPGPIRYQPYPLPRKRARVRMGVREPVRIIFRRHRRHAKSFGCAVPGCKTWPIDFAHGRTAANAGKAQTPHDAFGIGYCRAHHREEHAKGEAHMRRKYGVDRWKLAAYYVKTSPDHQIRQSFAQLPNHVQGLLFEERLHA